LLNPHGVVIYAPWWHPPLQDWPVASEHGDLNAAQVRSRIGDMLRRRDETWTAAPLSLSSEIS